MNTFNKILQDIEDQAEESQNNTAKTILTKITSTVSDRAATQIKLNTLLEEYRQKILPETINN